MPDINEPLFVQVAYRREQLDDYRRVLAWWESLSDEQRVETMQAYRRHNGGFTDATNAMLWAAANAMPKETMTNPPAAGRTNAK